MKLPRAHHLPINELVGQTLMPAINVRYFNRHSPQFRQLLTMTKNYHLGGFILFGGHPSDIHFCVEKLKKVAKYPMLIGADLERGVGGLFKNGTIFPHALAWGAANNLNLVADAAQVIAREARVLGINTIFAPVLDLVTHPENPIINIRGFRSDPEKVAEIGAAFIRSVQQEGIACVAKHFPGHGRTQSDSHLELPWLPINLSDLEKDDLYPFRVATEIGVKGIMSAHIQLKGDTKPATFRSDILQDYLRNKMGFNGLIFSDALNMQAIAQNFTPTQQVKLGATAGLDIFLMPEKLSVFFSALCDLASKDQKIRHTLQDSVDRIFQLKKWIHRQTPDIPHHRRVYKILEHPNHVGIANTLAEESVTCVHHTSDFPVRLPEIKNSLLIIHTDSEVVNKPLVTLQEQLSKFWEGVRTLINPTSEQIQQTNVDSFDLTVFSLYSRTYGGHQSQFNWKEINTILKLITETQNPPIVLVFGNPFHIRKLKNWKNSRAVFLLYSYVNASQKAAFNALTSFIPVKAKLPVALKSVNKTFKSLLVSENKYCLEKSTNRITDLPAVDQVIQEAIDKNAFPGAVVLVSINSRLVFHKSYGHFGYPALEHLSAEARYSKRTKSENNNGSTPVSPTTNYDLASLTKVLATTPAILKLVDNNMLDLNTNLEDIYSTLHSRPLGRASIADVLSHQAGLPAWHSFYKNWPNKWEIVNTILHTELECQVGERSIYSDLGFILLGDIIERISGVSLDVFCRDRIFRPLGLNSLHFIPVGQNSSVKRPSKNRKTGQVQYPPTGYDAFRVQIVQGEVNDTNCFVMGGVAGHAGLFGNAKDVAAAGQLFLNNGIYNRKRLFYFATAKNAVQPRKKSGSSRGLGWDTPGEESSSGHHFSPGSFGHLAFTGPSIWVDPQKQLLITFLCNRTHPDPQKNDMHRFRPILHDTIIESIKDLKLL